MQSGRSSGIGLFGGSASQSAFGAGSADVLTKITAILVAVFMLSGIGMALIKSRENSMQKVQEKFTEKPAIEDNVTTDKPAETTVNPDVKTIAPEAPVEKPAP